MMKKTYKNLKMQIYVTNEEDAIRTSGVVYSPLDVGEFDNDDNWA